MYSVHNASDLQFKPSEPYVFSCLFHIKILVYVHINLLTSVSDHNKKVQAFIIEEIISQPDNKVTEDVAKSKFTIIILV